MIFPNDQAMKTDTEQTNTNTERNFWTNGNKGQVFLTLYNTPRGVLVPPYGLDVYSANIWYFVSMISLIL